MHPRLRLPSRFCLTHVLMRKATQPRPWAFKSIDWSWLERSLCARDLLTLFFDTVGVFLSLIELTPFLGWKLLPVEKQSFLLVQWHFYLLLLDRTDLYNVLHLVIRHGVAHLFTQGPFLLWGTLTRVYDCHVSYYASSSMYHCHNAGIP
jgi:hypothetical protein